VPLGLKPAANWAQVTMSEDFISTGAAGEHVFDIIGMFHTHWDYHAPRIAPKVLKHLEDIGFTVNLCKCAWAVCETKWLGYYLTPAAYKPDYNIVVAPVLKLVEPTTVK
jgi:hypothetical protein